MNDEEYYSNSTDEPAQGTVTTTTDGSIWYS